MRTTAIRRGLVVASITLIAGFAVAGPAAATPAPNWSGMNVSNYSGPIPAAPGTLIQQVPLAKPLWVNAAASAYRFLYSTSNQHGPHATSTAEVFLPKGTPPKGGWPVIAWAHGTVGLGDNCTPSAQPAAARQQAYLGHWLDQGYAVVGTDYAGLGTPGLMSYLNGKVEAHNLVDSVRAARQLGQPLSNRWALVGQSQGAGAAMNGARYATEFSRGYGLDYRGVVATGTPANIETIVSLGGPTFPPVKLPTGLTTYAMYILAGFRDARPDLNVNSILSPLGRQLADQAETLCYDEFSKEMTGRDLRAMFVKPISSIPNAYGQLKEYMGTPDNGYDRPIFLGQGLTDIDVPAPSALSLAAALTANHQPLQLHLYPTDHSGTVYAATNDATAFLQSVMR